MNGFSKNINLIQTISAVYFIWMVLQMNIISAREMTVTPLIFLINFQYFYSFHEGQIQYSSQVDVSCDILGYSWWGDLSIVTKIIEDNHQNVLFFWAHTKNKYFLANFDYIFVSVDEYEQSFVQIWRKSIPILSNLDGMITRSSSNHS